jgi:hypothetical protein
MSGTLSDVALGGEAGEAQDEGQQERLVFRQVGIFRSFSADFGPAPELFIDRKSGQFLTPPALFQVGGDIP